MSCIQECGGTQKKELPTDDGVLHVWKVIIPLSDTAGLYEESDAFRKRFNNSLVYRLNIHSTILGDTQATRKGKLFFYNSQPVVDIDLNDVQIDSIVRS